MELKSKPQAIELECDELEGKTFMSLDNGMYQVLVPYTENHPYREKWLRYFMINLDLQNKQN